MTGSEVDVRAAPMGELDVVFQSLADSIVSDAKVGVRVAVCGAEADVLLLRAGLLECGFLDEEVFAHATSIDLIRVRCAHCGRITRHRARPGGVVNCQSCSYDEVVHHHFSRRLAAYLAFRVDAEAGLSRPGEALDGRG